MYISSGLENILAKWPSNSLNEHPKVFLHDTNKRSSRKGIKEILLPCSSGGVGGSAYCEAIKSSAVLKQILQPDDSTLLKQQVLLIHLGLNTLIPKKHISLRRLHYYYKTTQLLYNILI